MRPKEKEIAKRLKRTLQKFAHNEHPLPGIVNSACMDVFIEQLIESIRRVEYIAIIKQRDISPSRADPRSPEFDPLKAALLKYRSGEIDEAIWLVFLATHFGKHLTDGWKAVRQIYGAKGNLSKQLTWTRVIAFPDALVQWLAIPSNTLDESGRKLRFSSHRKYESLRHDAKRGFATVVKSYVKWIGANRGHQLTLQESGGTSTSDPKKFFDKLYHSIKVTSFGRLAKFDFLTMLGKLGFLNIEPGSPYLKDATGPQSGARLLFDGNITSNTTVEKLDTLVIKLGSELGLGMQIMEDALCNWQKSPNKFIPFRG